MRKEDLVWKEESITEEEQTLEDGCFDKGRGRCGGMIQPKAILIQSLIMAREIENTIGNAQWNPYATIWTLRRLV